MSKIFTAVIVSGLLLWGSLAGAWPSAPDANLVICDRTGEQTVPKLAAAPDGGCYVSWFDHGGASYAVYLQRLDAQGNPLWAQNGLLISNNPQSTSLTDWDLAVDSTNSAIVVFNDTRTDANRDIYAYRISPDGEFLWGANGIALSATGNTDFEADPRVIISSAGNVIIAWQGASGGHNAVKIRKLSLAGADLWTPTTVAITSTYGNDYPRIAPALEDGFVASYVVRQGSSFSSPRHIYMQKFDASGTVQWAAAGVPVFVGNGMGIQVKPFLLADSLGGAFCTWYDSRLGGINLRCWAQHILSDATVSWTANGVQTDTSTVRMQMSPVACRIPGTQEIIVAYLESDASQGNFSIGAQRIGSTGARQWTNAGILYSPLDPLQESNILCYSVGDGAVVVFEKLLSFGGQNSGVEAFRVDGTGAMVWETSPRVMCSVSSIKMRLAADVNRFGQVMATWPDGRVDPSWDLYLQNINPDGSLGNLPVVTIDAPQEVTVAPVGSDIHLRWHSVTGATSYNIRAGTDMMDFGTLVGSVTDTTATLPGESDAQTKRFYYVSAVRN
ncbi:MAG TPA: hypothetical protein VGL38_11765 [bacterium]|jgi:hypothetical protein